MELKAIHTYQAVFFNKSNRNFISAEMTGLSSVKMKLQKENNIVEVTMGDETIIIFPTNIAYAVPAAAKQSTKYPPKLAEEKLK